MTVRSESFRSIASGLLATAADERERNASACVEMWAEFSRDEKTALAMLLAHVVADESDTGAREEELWALAEAANMGELSPAAQDIVRARGLVGLDQVEAISWHDIVDERVGSVIGRPTAPPKDDDRSAVRTA